MLSTNLPVEPLVLKPSSVVMKCTPRFFQILEEGNRVWQ